MALVKFNNTTTEKPIKTLRKLTQDELNKILKLHSKWLSDNKKGKRANLSYTDCSNLDFSELSGICEANCEGGNFRGANFNSTLANFTNFKGSDLSYANFESSDCTGADFTGAIVERTKFIGSKRVNLARKARK